MRSWLERQYVPYLKYLPIRWRLLRRPRTLSTMKLEELMGTLQIFEMNLEEEMPVKKIKELLWRPRQKVKRMTMSLVMKKTCLSHLTCWQRILIVFWRSLSACPAMMFHNRFQDCRRTIGIISTKRKRNYQMISVSLKTDDQEFNVENLVVFDTFNSSVLICLRKNRSRTTPHRVMVTKTKAEKEKSS